MIVLIFCCSLVFFFCSFLKMLTLLHNFPFGHFSDLNSPCTWHMKHHSSLIVSIRLVFVVFNPHWHSFIVTVFSFQSMIGLCFFSQSISNIIFWSGKVIFLRSICSWCSCISIETPFAWCVIRVTVLSVESFATLSHGSFYRDSPICLLVASSI